MDGYSIPEYYKSTNGKDKLSFRGFRYHHDRKYGDKIFYSYEITVWTSWFCLLFLYWIYILYLPKTQMKLEIVINWYWYDFRSIWNVCLYQYHFILNKIVFCFWCFIRETSYKMSIQIQIRWVTSWENLCLPYANNKGSDQPAQSEQRLCCSLPE